MSSAPALKPSRVLVGATTRKGIKEDGLSGEEREGDGGKTGS
jgi:hypothetical protein